jgi:hypothetical protein
MRNTPEREYVEPHVILDELADELGYVERRFGEHSFQMHVDAPRYWQTLRGAFEKWMAGVTRSSRRPIESSPLTCELLGLLDEVTARQPSTKESCRQTLRRLGDILSTVRDAAMYALKTPGPDFDTDYPSYRVARLKKRRHAEDLWKVAGNMPNTSDYQRDLLRDERYYHSARILLHDETDMVVGYYRIVPDLQLDGVHHVRKRITALGVCKGPLIPEALGAALVGEVRKRTKLRGRDQYRSYHELQPGWPDHA